MCPFVCLDHVCAHVHVHLSVVYLSYLSVSACMYLCLCLRMHVSVVCLYVCICISMYVHIPVLLCVCMCLLYIFAWNKTVIERICTWRSGGLISKSQLSLPSLAQIHSALLTNNLSVSRDSRKTCLSKSIDQTRSSVQYAIQKMILF